MRVLAFDPGYERLGVAILEKQKGKEELLYSQCFRTSKTLPFPQRLKILGQEAEALIKKWKPDAVALEEVYFKNNAKTAMQVAEVRGMLTYIAALHDVPLHQYTPGEVKVATAGSGSADKRAVAAMVARLVVLPARKRLDDELDAIAVGITCLASTRPA
ncbi:MAG: crossover junction endodeoxyribonuclease RuvC [Patescibacteria group bacterium]|nr:crossover junction endodeoxyribonuclease RuvC [Patescibacteria group bacterium]